MAEKQNRVLIFGGTSEGRELAEYAAARQVRVLVSVVSEYGEHLLEESDYVSVRRGALSQEAMKALLDQVKPELVLDATHPYASVVTEQISKLCQEASVLYWRVFRAEEKTEAEGYRVRSPEEAVSVLEQNQEPVLLTTGSKELAVFAKKPQLKGRLYARVLPDSRVLADCEALGICGAHLIAMQGPFSVEMNRAMLKQTGAKWLVTKESGGRGGFAEKIQAAKECGVSVIVIERPIKEEGISLIQAKRMLEQYRGAGPDTGTAQTADSGPRELFLIGMGMGGGRQLTLEAVEALKQCSAVLGAPRMLADVAEWTGHALREACYLPEEVFRWLEQHEACRKAALVYSGDTGFYSGCTSVIRKIQETGRSQNWKLRVFPGISSVSNLCARMEISWERLYLASAHGRDCDAVSLLKQHERVFLLLGGKETLRSICRKLTEAGYGETAVKAGVCMGYPNERWITGTAEELTDCSTEALAAVILERQSE